MLKFDRLKASIAVAIAFSCLATPQTLAQSAGLNAGLNAANASQVNACFLAPANTLTESAIQPEAMRFYERAVRELHQGHAVAAEKDAIRALPMCVE